MKAVIARRYGTPEVLRIEDIPLPVPGKQDIRIRVHAAAVNTGDCRIRGFDVVELAPIPGMVAPDFLAAKLIYRIMGYLTRKR